jgi:hypothetical protein
MRYRSPSLYPGGAILEGDDRFLRMNSKLSREKLQAGEYYEAVNKRVVNGVAATRGGTITPVELNAVSMAGGILGSAVYSNPNGDEVILIALPDKVLMLRSGAYPTTVAIPSGLTLTGSIEFSQQFDKVLLHSGASQSTLVWNGVSDSGFEVVTKSSPDNAARDLLPNVAWAINMNGRTIFPFSKDQIGATDALDYSMYDPIFGVFRVNAGTSDPIVGAYPFPNSNVIIGKRKSLDILANFTGDFTNPSSPDYLNPTMQVLSSTVGIVARKTGKMLGADFAFLSDTGFYKISQVVQERLQAGAVPFSDPIEPHIQRINWVRAGQAVAAVLGRYYFCAVPIDGSTYNNAVLVYDSATDGWVGYDTWASGAGMRIDDLLVTDYLGTSQLYAINHGTNSVHVLYLDTATEDTTSNGEFQISDLLKTRGYADLGQTGVIDKDYKRVGIGLATLRPSITVTQVLEGENNTRALTSSAITKDRTKYYQWGKQPYVVTNANNDFFAPGREDYTVKIDDGFAADSGIAVDLKQNKPEKFSLHGRGRWIGFDIANTQGRCDVLGVIVESQGLSEVRRAA